MSAEYVTDLAEREAAVNAEFGEAGEVALNQIEMVEMGLADYSTFLQRQLLQANLRASWPAKQASYLFRWRSTSAQ